MGLDNIPANYACESAGTAIHTDNNINCKLTQENGGCPWKASKNSDPLVKDTLQVIGILGTSCWLRGKAYEWMLDAMKENNSEFPELSFYGQASEQGDDRMDPEYCLYMADTMAQFSEEWIRVVDSLIKDGELYENEKDRYINDWAYASWWLRFVAKNCEGAICWW